MQFNRTLFIVGQLGNGGLEKQLSYIVDNLKKADKEIACIVWNNENDDFYSEQFKQLLGNNLVILKQQSFLKKVKELRKLSINFKPDVVISFSTFTNFYTFLANLFTGNKVLGSLRSNANAYLKENKMKGYLNLKFPKNTLINNHTSIEELSENKKIKKANFIYLQNVIDINLYQNPESKKSEFDFEYTVSIGNARKSKRLDRMVKIFSIIKQQNVGSIKHIHIGGGKDLNEIQKLIDDQGLNDQITLIGPKGDVRNYLINASALLHFSEFEGSSNVIMEAMASKLPIITTNCGDSKYYVIDNHNGFIIEPYSAQSFINKYNLLINDKNLQKIMSEKSYEDIKKSDISSIGQIFKNALNKYK